jgi:hypothetical protein
MQDTDYVTGWRMTGRDFVSPDVDRINPRRLTGILWAERSRSRIYSIGSRKRETLAIATLPARERFSGSA